MADFIFQPGRDVSTPGRFSEFYELSLRPLEGLLIHGNDGTFTLVEDGDDFIAVLGHCSFPGRPTRPALLETLRSFREPEIAGLKNVLAGQFVLLVRKGNLLCVFSDCLQARNVFYSAEERVVSSSFSVAEDAVNAVPEDLSGYKVFEHLAMYHFFYAAGLGPTTINRRIRQLRPFEYLALELPGGALRVEQLTREIDNRKVFDIEALAGELASRLETVIRQPELLDRKVVATLTAGYDSRLIAAVAASCCRNISFRISVADGNPNSAVDLAVVPRVARAAGVPLDIYRFAGEPDRELFYRMSEGFAPAVNSIIISAVRNADAYDLGLGGVFGTELFYPPPVDAVEEYIDRGISRGRPHFSVPEAMWDRFRTALAADFSEFRDRYPLAVPDEFDLIRLFGLVHTGRFSSSMTPLYNIRGAQMEPYGSFPIIETALKVPREYSGSNTGLERAGRVQKAALARVNYAMARVTTSHFCPMAPLNVRTLPGYLSGYFRHALHSLKRRAKRTGQPGGVTSFAGGSYRSDGWNEGLVRRIRERYGPAVELRQSALESSRKSPALAAGEG